MRKIKTLLYQYINRYNNPSYWWRIREKILNVTNPYIYVYIYNKILRLNNASIPYNVNIEEEPVFPHGLNGVFISSGAKIGKNCIIFHQVTIGSNTLLDSKKSGAPTIGDNVYIGAGAKIIGNVKVGNNVRIGANCVIAKDIPDNCTVVLSTPIIIEHEGVKDNRFISWDEYMNKKNVEGEKI